jgi:hypothetical protein
MNDTPDMTKEDSPLPKAKQDDLGNLPKDANEAVARLEHENEEYKKASNNLQKFLSAIPAESRSQFLTAIGSNDFLKSFGTPASVEVKNEDGSKRVMFKNGTTTAMGEEDPDQGRRQSDANITKAYNAFVEGQNNTLKEEYERFKARYAANNRFGNVKIPFQTFTSGFQITSAPCLGDQTIKKVVLCKDDRGNTPNCKTEDSQEGSESHQARNHHMQNQQDHYR